MKFCGHHLCFLKWGAQNTCFRLSSLTIFLFLFLFPLQGFMFEALRFSTLISSAWWHIIPRLSMYSLVFGLGNKRSLMIVKTCVLLSSQQVSYVCDYVELQLQYHLQTTHIELSLGVFMPRKKISKIKLSHRRSSNL